MKIYIIRHGESQGNVNGTYHGDEDYELSDKGIDQVKNLKKILDEKIHSQDIKRVLTSPLKRATQTAEILGFDEPIIKEELKERNFGIFEGLDYAYIMKEHPQEWKSWEEDWQGYVPENGESHLMVADRVFEFMDELLKQEEDSVLVTHAGIIRMIYCYVMDKNPDLFWKFACNNCQMGVIRYEYGNLFIENIF